MNFERDYGLDIEALIVKLSEKPRILVMQGRYVAQVGGEEYDLGTVRKPLGKAISAAVDICRERVIAG